MRISWSEYFIKIVKAAAERSTCPRGTVGALIVKNNNIVGTGYNGAPRNMAHCTDVGCAIGEDNHCHRAVHAEINAIIQAGKESKGAILYVTHQPCINCCQAIIQAGIEKVIYINKYNDNRMEAFDEYDNQKEFLEAGGVEAVHFRG
ncbi:MAG: deoxycytidylate deaminase [Bacillota bacterium]